MITDETIEKALAAARRAQKRSHSPYSKFAVGAAIITESGAIVGGCNVENASYGLTICAERTAMTRVVAEGKGRPLACVVVGPTPEVITPCGACRQFLREFNAKMEIICVSTTGARKTHSLAKLLPFSFGPDDLT